jgi:hypothetical protein
MKTSPTKSSKTDASKKRSRSEAEDASQSSTPPSTPRPNPAKEWKKAKLKTVDLLALVNSGFLREKESDLSCTATGDPCPMGKNSDEILMFARFVVRGLALPVSEFFKGMLRYYNIEYLNVNPNKIFHIFVFVHFCEAFVGIKPHWILFHKFFRLKAQPSTNDSRVVRGACIQMRDDATDQYLSYKLIESNQDWKAKWFYISNHHPELSKPSGHQLKHKPWWNTGPTMQEGIQLPELLKIKALREARLRAEHVAFNFMKRRVQPLMARGILGYQYMGDEDTSWMPSFEVEDDVIIEWLGKIFKDMPPYTPCSVPEHSATCPPNKISSRDRSPRVLVCLT